MQHAFEFTLHFSLNLDAVLPSLWAWLADFYPFNFTINLLIVLRWFSLWRPVRQVKKRRSVRGHPSRRRSASRGIKDLKRPKPKTNRHRKSRGVRKAAKSKPLKARTSRWDRFNLNNSAKRSRKRAIKGFRQPHAKSMKHTAYLKNKAGELLAVSVEGDCHCATAWCPLCEEKCPHLESANGPSHSVELALCEISSHLQFSHDLRGYELDLMLSKL